MRKTEYTDDAVGDEGRGARFLHGASQSQGGGNHEYQISVHGTGRLADIENTGEEHHRGAKQSGNHDRQDAGRSQAYNAQENQVGAPR